MDVKSEEFKREEFRKILYDLAISQEMLQDKKTRYDMYIRLEKLYYSPREDKMFRHFYSDIFSVLLEIKQSSKDIGSIDVLGQNLDVLRKGYNAINYDADGNLIDISDSIRKLYDHVSLDIARIMYSEAEDRRIVSYETIQEVRSDVDEVKTGIDKAYQKIKSQQKEYISILGIFASVILAFMGGMVFSTSVFNNIAQVSIYRILIASLIIGLVFTNIIYSLFYYINKIVDNSGKLRPIIITNAVIVLLITAVVVAWGLGAVEKRDSKINSSVETVQSAS
ncbi:MAG: hypothetical protein PUD90_08155 [Clostridia bacterium]|nr:hypothetical protein [Clostridia bacterium]